MISSTPPEPPVSERNTDVLIEDMCVALRDLAYCSIPTSKNHMFPKTIKNFQEIYSEIKSRGVSVDKRLERLTKETRWLMVELFKEAIDWPRSIPLVRDPDGIRRYLRCYICRKAEMLDWEGIPFCDSCLQMTSESLRTGSPKKNQLSILPARGEFALCKHSGPTGPFIKLEWEDFDHTYCRQCLQEELTRRATLKTQK